MDTHRASEWLRFGDMDLEVSEHTMKLMRPAPYEIICYHCQQAVEKYLKGYLNFRGVEDPPHIHHLTKLCLLCVEYDESFNDILRECAFLTGYASGSRYPDEIYVDEEITKQAISYANRIKDFAPLAAVRQELEQALEDETTRADPIE